MELSCCFYKFCSRPFARFGSFFLTKGQGRTILILEGEYYYKQKINPAHLTLHSTRRFCSLPTGVSFGATG